MRLELGVHNALAQRFELVLDLESFFVAGTQTVGQVIVFIAFAGQQGFALKLQSQSVLQTSTCGGVAQYIELFLLPALFVV